MELDSIKNNISKLNYEISRRLKGHHISTDMIGIELKMRRKMLSLTLSDVSSNICSVSYLCKIETSKIKANRICLNDICSRLGLENDSLDTLMNLDKLLINMVKGYFDNNKSLIEKLFKSGKELKNYRYQLVTFIYYIYFKKYEEAIEIANQLIKLISVLNDIDLVVFTLFYDILNFNDVNNEEIYEGLKKLTLVVPLDDSIICLIKLLEVKCLFTMNSALLIQRIEELSSMYLKISRFDLIEELKYIRSMFYLFNNEIDAFKLEKDHIHSKEYVHSLNIYEKILKGEKILVKDLSSVEGYAYLVGLSKIDSSKALELLDQSNFASDSVEYDSSIIEYLTLQTLEEKYDFILSIALPQFKASRNKMVANFYAMELLKITGETNKYKLFYQLYLEMNS